MACGLMQRTLWVELLELHLFGQGQVWKQLAPCAEDLKTTSFDDIGNASVIVK